MRKRPTLLLYLGVTLGFSAIFIHAQAQGQNIAVIKSHNIAPFNQALAGFTAACNQDITEYDLRGSTRRQKRIIKRIRATKPTIILAVGALAAQVAKEGIRDIPVVFCMVPNPHKYNLRGKNIAGISLDIPVEVQFAQYKALVPTLRTIGAIYDPQKTGTIITEANAAARKLNLQFLASPVHSQKEVPAALRSLLGKINALWMLPDDTVITPESFKFLLLTAFENNIPFLTISDIFVEKGALAALSPDYANVGRQACQLIREIESGRLNLTEVDAVPPDKVNLAINLKAANKIGLILPPAIVQSASKVFR
ncbi:MAG: ABC transporter substrate-binding protein [Candidatus Tectomicrobia bacterium]